MEEKNYFVTDDTALAAYLYLQGFEFIEATITNRNNPNRKKFIMIDRPDREQLEYDFYIRKPVNIAPLDYHDAKVAVARYLKFTVPDPRPPEVQR